MRAGFFLRLFWTGFISNVVIAFGIVFAMNLEPKENVHITTQQDAILLFGNNQLGLTSFRVFKNWAHMKAYIDAHSLSLPQLTYAEAGIDPDATILQSKVVEGVKYYRIFWEDKSQQQLSFSTQLHMHTETQKPHSRVLHAPDPESALEIAKYLRYFRLSHSVMGFALPLHSLVSQNDLSI